MKYDLIVCGGGTAGAMAAITAARLKLNVAIIEAANYLGGTSTGGMVTPMMGNFLNGTALNLGLTTEMLSDLTAQGQAAGYCFNPWALKTWLEKKAHDAGVTIFLESRIVNAAPNEVSFANRSGIEKLTARFLIDATGDAVVAQLLGAPVRTGREDTGVHQPMSLRFVLGHLDLARLKQSLIAIGGETAVHMPLNFLHSGDLPYLKAYAEKAQWPQNDLDTFGVQFFETPGRPNELWFNCPRLAGFDPLNPVSLSAAMLKGRQLIEKYVDLFKDNLDGAQGAYLVAAAEMVGIREGRRIVGEYILIDENFFNADKFDDGICFNTYPIDIHKPDTSGVELHRIAKGQWQEIPYRCLIPKGLSSILVAGRCISSDFTSQASYRIIPNCHTLGQAAAVAVKLAIDQRCDVSELDGRNVRKTMIASKIIPDL